MGLMKPLREHRQLLAAKRPLPATPTEPAPPEKEEEAKAVATDPTRS